MKINKTRPRFIVIFETKFWLITTKQRFTLLKSHSHVLKPKQLDRLYDNIT